MIQLLLLLTSVTALAQSPAPGCIQLAIDGIRSDQGQLIVAVFDVEAAFENDRSPVQAAKPPARGGRVEVGFCGLVAGRYAVSMFHDENSNGTLDTRLGIPMEGFGFSRSPVIKTGKPTFDEVAVEITESAPVHDEAVRLRYVF